ncbi:MAG TPA: hypothetical protein PLA50_10905, partial [Bacteroidia bacterium]|nr:hypothetical protein [Bacteroidia bacterium]
MHELNFALLKDWLPVGVSAILFFGIGLLLAKFIWGRYNQRLANAIEENMALAGQWSSLGASQQDLFKKLRVRWQADRDAYEADIAEKELKIALLGERIKAGGGSLASVDAASEEIFAVRARIGELESALESERAEAAKLREELDKVAEMPILPFAVKEKAVAEVEAPESRLRELEQDLIDTHDELHRVRADYEKQLALVESLEARLIAVPEPVAEPQADPELHQLRALLSVRGRELRRSREEFVQTKIASLEAHRGELASREAELAARNEEIIAAKEAELAARSEEVVSKEAEIVAKDEEIVAKEA